MREEVKSVLRIYKMTLWSSALKWLLLIIPATVAYAFALVIRFTSKFELKEYAVWSVVVLAIGFLVNIIFDFCLEACKKRNVYFAESCGRTVLSSAKIADIIIDSYHIHEKIDMIAKDNAKLLCFDTKRHKAALEIYADLWLDAICREYNTLNDKAIESNEYGFVKEFLYRQISLKKVFMQVFNWNHFFDRELEKWFKHLECKYKALSEQKK